VVYALHADASADLEDVRDSDTRRKQFTQLVDYIRDDNYTIYVNIPIIILGDTNCTQLDIDKTTINDYLISPLESMGYNVEEALPNEDIDRIFVANPINSNRKVIINGCEHGVNGLSDHRPFIMDFDIIS
jgi:endonuclease/exonuclease/phosphatase family metal-dependent hydrolase